MNGKRLAARLICAGGMVAASATLGNAIRGPFADTGFVRDVAAGGVVIGASFALAWAANELGNTPGEWPKIEPGE
jgi:hypothetical protein